jgi:transcriptional regulator with XRE-family HTH domain
MEARPLLELLELVDQREGWAAEAGKKLREARDAADLSQADLAALAGVSQPYVSKVENGGGVSTETLRHFKGVIEAYTTTGGTGVTTGQAATQGETTRRSKQKHHA